VAKVWVSLDKRFLTLPSGTNSDRKEIDINECSRSALELATKRRALESPREREVGILERVWCKWSSKWEGNFIVLLAGGKQKADEPALPRLSERRIFGRMWPERAQWASLRAHTVRRRAAESICSAGSLSLRAVGRPPATRTVHDWPPVTMNWARCLHLLPAQAAP